MVQMEKTAALRVVGPHPRFVIGDDALIEAVGDQTVAEPPALTVNGVPVAGDVARQAAGCWRALVTGLVSGENVVEADIGDERVTLRVTSFPVEGPIFSGPHLQPWLCTTEAAGLGPPVDANCNAPSRFDYFFMSSETGAFEPYDLDAPPAADAIASATTDQGLTVPYVVRRETGAANRGIYELAVLCDPRAPWSGANPQPVWNRKLWIYSYGGWNQHWSQSTFDIERAAFTPERTILVDEALRRGFMAARTTHMQSATNTDTIRAAESLVMLKDHITKRYGEIRYTFASGASGGSIMQQMIANQYPGIFQGIIPMSSVHATWYVPTIIIESRLLQRYFTEISPELWQSEADRLAADGHRTEETRNFFNVVFVDSATAGSLYPTRGTKLPPEQTYDPERNPGGARGTLQDYQVNYLGRRSPEVWTVPEREIGRGFANLPWDNVGVQYGLGALLDGKITVEQFVDVNEKIGGVDVEHELTAERTEADPDALARVHRGGFLNDFANMSDVAILDVRNPEDQDVIRSHTQFHTWVTRDGLRAAQGHADNHVAWIVSGFDTAATPLEASFLAMDRWLAAIEADDSDRPLAEKVVANKPADVVDGIFDLDGVQRGDLADYHRVYPSYGDARTVAANGDLRALRIMKAQLKPLERADYPGVEFSDDEWARLQRIFPRGVADWSKDGVGHTRTVPWLTYDGGPGGEPFGLVDAS